jgi:hypothetical protein
VRTLREHTMTFPNFALTSGAGAAAGAGNTAAPGTAGTPPASIDDVKKAGEALRGLFGKGKK